jgi:hypothetical protein
MAQRQGRQCNRTRQQFADTPKKAYLFTKQRPNLSAECPTVSPAPNLTQRETLS